MRVALGSLGQTVGTTFVPINYPGFGPFATTPAPTSITPGVSASTPISLVDGSVISNPMSTAPTGNQCLPYQCGADPDNAAARAWCAFWGQSAAYACADVQCAPVASLLTEWCPSPTLAAPAPVTANPALPMLTPQNITQPLPDITAATAPTPVATPSCSFWCVLNQAIDDNPLIAALVLAGGAFLLWPKGKRA
jgi:hypothetical protein